MKNGHLRILNDLEERGMRRKEGRGGRRDGEEGGTGRKKGRGELSEKNEKVIENNEK